jgi:hypothetical protein
MRKSAASNTMLYDVIMSVLSDKRCSLWGKLTSPKSNEEESGQTEPDLPHPRNVHVQTQQERLMPCLAIPFTKRRQPPQTLSERIPSRWMLLFLVQTSTPTRSPLRYIAVLSLSLLPLCIYFQFRSSSPHQRQHPSNANAMPTQRKAPARDLVPVGNGELHARSLVDAMLLVQVPFGIWKGCLAKQSRLFDQTHAL